jgi:translation elongation factor EF-G
MRPTRKVKRKLTCTIFFLRFFRDKERIEKIVQSLNLKISARDSRQNDSKAHLQAIFHQWLPLPKAVLEMVVEKLPSPLEISSERVEKLMCGGLRSFESLPDETKSLKQGMYGILYSGIGVSSRRREVMF